VPSVGERQLRIAVVSTFYSEGMGYTENCLPRALAARGHEVHVVTTIYNVYGNQAAYAKTYQDFLGPNIVRAGMSSIDGYTVHRLDARVVGGYVVSSGLAAKVREIAPDVVHSLEIASLQTYELALLKPFVGFRLFCETHQHMSVVRPFLKVPGALCQKLFYRMTRTLPTRLASLTVEKCYAISPDCAEVATRFYGVAPHKVTLQSLGADTQLFHPVESEADVSARSALRRKLGFTDEDIVCVYSGRFSRDKNPLLLARAIDALHGREPRFKGLFIGEGVQKDEMAACRNTTIVSFMKHRSLAEHYRAADIAVWPTQESMSMLDAASSGLPIIVSNTVGEVERVNGNGRMYEENDVESMVAALLSLGSEADRQALGAVGRLKMLNGFSWMSYARLVEADYRDALERRRAKGHRRP
jgi:glycosyltransferase involved in cell wall biosynthesis